jgi:hypothetical protein
MQPARTDTCSLANEGRNKHGPSEMGEKNEKSCRGNEQALAISFARLDADSTENDFTYYRKEQEAQDRKSTTTREDITIPWLIFNDFQV